MTQFALSIAVLYWLSLAGVALGVYAIFRTRGRLHAAEKAAAVRGALYEAAMEELRKQFEASVRQLRDTEQPPPLPAPPKPGLNLTKRSQALRMHRRGDPPEQIAAALEVPHQEVDLLLKVHRIVIADL